MRNFLSKYEFDFYDITTVITIINVTGILQGLKYAPLFGLLNCVLLICYSYKHKFHINNYITQLALIVLNIKFLIG